MGRNLIDKVGAGKSQYISQRLRQLGRLVLTLRSLTEGEEVFLADFLKPDLFDLVIQAVMVVCQLKENTPESGTPEFGIPSLSLKLGHSLKKCALILQGEALRNRDGELLETAKMYLQLHESEWSDKIASHALSTMANLKFNKPDILPVTSDLIKLRQFLLDEIQVRCRSLEQHPSPENWTALVEVCLSRLIVFNKRRGGEASRLLCKPYEERPV